MGFLRWVGDQLKRAAHTPAALLSEIGHVAGVLWHVLTGLGTLVRGAWAAFNTGLDDLGKWVASLAGATWARLKDILTNVIPAAARWALREAWKAASAAVGALRTWTRTALAVATRYAQKIVNDLRGWAQESVRWLTSHAADAVNRLTRLERRVFALLDAPEHLAAWVFGALWSYAWRYLRRGEVAITRWLVRNAVALILREVPTIEAVIADIL